MTEQDYSDKHLNREKHLSKEQEQKRQSKELGEKITKQLLKSQGSDYTFW